MMAAGDSLTEVHSELSVVPEWLNHNACYRKILVSLAATINTSGELETSIVCEPLSMPAMGSY